MSGARWFAVLAVIAWSALAALVLRQRFERRGADHRGPGRRFVRARGTLIAVGILVFFATVALVAPLLTPYRPSLQLDIVRLQNAPPSWGHPLGTDLYSRDTWSRIAYGARVSLSVGTLAMLLAATLGALVGAAAGYFRRWTDAVLMRLVDVGLAIPRIFILLVAAALTTHLPLATLVLMLGLTSWFATSRLVRAEVLSIRERDFVASARALGGGAWRVIFRHVLPNVAAPLIVSMALGIAQVMLLEAALSFLGVGVQPPTPSWGNMIAEGRDQLATAPWTTIFPGLAIVLVVMALNTVADALRDALDPRQETP
ncbi:MAG TPA: ABC transporter permease [Gemmatimonadales bacterium]|nr:ABC transporter permease [Gemmatimonadales bacterium]